MKTRTLLTFSLVALCFCATFASAEVTLLGDGQLILDTSGDWLGTWQGLNPGDPGVIADTAASWYVDKAGSDSNSGREEGAPKLTIQAAHDAGIGTGSRNIFVGAGSYPETLTNFAVGENVGLIGNSAKNTSIKALTVATNHQGVVVRDLSFYSMVTVGNQFNMPAGTPTGYEVLLQDVAFIEVMLIAFTDSPFKVAGGTLEMRNVSFIALTPNFNGMGTGAGDWMHITNAPDIHMHGTHFTITDMVNTNISINMIHDVGTGATRVKNTDMDITWASAFSGEVRGMLFENNSSEKIVENAEIHVVGTDDTVGEAEGIVGKGTAIIRAEKCIINISGFLDRYSYETYDTANINVNGASDVNCTYTEAVSGQIQYTGSPEDGMMEWESARFGQDGEVRTGWPEPSSSSGHNGIAYVSFGQASEVVSGEAVTYNNLIIADDGTTMNLTDSDSSYMDVTITITNWNQVENNGENTAGTLFPQKAVRGNIESIDGVTAEVQFSGLIPDEEYVIEILGSAAHGGKDCDDMWYWLDAGVATTGSVTVVDNTSTLVTLTNTPSGTTMTLFCKEQNGDDAYLNAFRLTGPTALGYLRVDGGNAMQALIPQTLNDTNWLYGIIDTPSGSNAFAAYIEGSANTNVWYLTQ